MDCRPAEQYNAGHLSTAFHLDSDLVSDASLNINFKYYVVLKVLPFISDAPKPLGVCPLCEVPFGGTKAVSRVGLYCQWRAPVLHGKWKGGGGHVHEHGIGPFSTGKSLTVLLSRDRCEIFTALIMPCVTEKQRVCQYC